MILLSASTSYEKMHAYYFVLQGDNIYYFTLQSDWRGGNQALFRAEYSNVERAWYHLQALSYNEDVFFHKINKVLKSNEAPGDLIRDSYKITFVISKQ